jgi:hypothetical protein
MARSGLNFFFSSELSYSSASPQVTASRVFHVHPSDRQKSLAKPVFIGENIHVCLSQDSPHHPRKIRTHWPVKQGSGKLECFRASDAPLGHLAIFGLVGSVGESPITWWRSSHSERRDASWRSSVRWRSDSSLKRRASLSASPSLCGVRFGFFGAGFVLGACYPRVNAAWRSVLSHGPAAGRRHSRL